MVVVVTGGGSGIGLATATLLAELGASVAVLDVKNTGMPAGILPLTCDITNDTTVHTAIATTVSVYGRIDAVVNNAAIAGGRGSIENLDIAAWQQVWDVNVLGAVRVTSAALPHLRRSAAPVIVNTCSMVVGFGLPGLAMYAATKGALHALTLATAADLAADGIRVVGVAPGPTDTGNGNTPTDRIPIHRLLDPKEVAHVTASLLTATGVTGVVWPVTGGMGTVQAPQIADSSMAVEDPDTMSIPDNKLATPTKSWSSL
jgi:NAD(P)-dependent dehydrogenase (short-subunit alcohol dehydrogenase family)